MLCEASHSISGREMLVLGIIRIAASYPSVVIEQMESRSGVSRILFNCQPGWFSVYCVA